METLRIYSNAGHEYVLVRSHDPLNIIDLEDTLENMETLEFIMIKKTSMRMFVFARRNKRSF